MTLFKSDYARCVYPLGLGYIAALLEKYGYVVKIVDSYAEGYHLQQPVEGHLDFIKYGLPDEDLIALIEEFLRLIARALILEA